MLPSTPQVFEAITELFDVNFYGGGNLYIILNDAEKITSKPHSIHTLETAPAQQKDKT